MRWTLPRTEPRGVPALAVLPGGLPLSGCRLHAKEGCMSGAGQTCSKHAQVLASEVMIIMATAGKFCGRFGTALARQFAEEAETCAPLGCSRLHGVGNA